MGGEQAIPLSHCGPVVCHERKHRVNGSPKERKISFNCAITPTLRVIEKQLAASPKVILTLEPVHHPQPNSVEGIVNTQVSTNCSTAQLSYHSRNSMFLALTVLGRSIYLGFPAPPVVGASVTSYVVSYLDLSTLSMPTTTMNAAIVNSSPGATESVPSPPTMHRNISMTSWIEVLVSGRTSQQVTVPGINIMETSGHGSSRRPLSSSDGTGVATAPPSQSPGVMPRASLTSLVETSSEEPTATSDELTAPFLTATSISSAVPSSSLANLSPAEFGTSHSETKIRNVKTLIQSRSPQEFALAAQLINTPSGKRNVAEIIKGARTRSPRSVEREQIEVLRLQIRNGRFVVAKWKLMNSGEERNK
ncbi:hypothetical protein PR048_009966 [Dryococelus australis]|uniref:Uncharacterized protein n=1 Tax=Dryococelus australis TaxID=614101 RepID=A0ABQ9I1G8_9NEOP|nr:hypothetical protein PR048_009966 [Dryococelus australis]